MNLIYAVEDLQSVAEKRLAAIEILEEQVNRMDERIDNLLITIARYKDDLNRAQAYNSELLDKIMGME